MNNGTAPSASSDPIREAEERGRRRGHAEAADYLDRVAAEWTETEGGRGIARALRLEARNLRRMYLERLAAGLPAR